MAVSKWDRDDLSTERQRFEPEDLPLLSLQSSLLLKTVLLDYADNTANADRKTGLAEPLGDDLNCGVWIEEAVANDLANNVISADIVALRTCLVGLESCGPLFTKAFQQLKISLSGKPKLVGGLDGAEPFALAFNEHGQSSRNEIIRPNWKIAGRADDAMRMHVELQGLVLQHWLERQRNRMAVGTPGG
jgi:hypothetical protein